MKTMEQLMKVLQYILLGLVMFIHPIMPSLALLGLSVFYLQKHDWEAGFFEDRWGAIGSISFLLGIIVYVAMVYLPSRA
jgi:hypothetical protein